MTHTYSRENERNDYSMVCLISTCFLHVIKLGKARTHHVLTRAGQLFLHPGVPPQMAINGVCKCASYVAIQCCWVSALSFRR